jgi:hypothetical protein
MKNQINPTEQVRWEILRFCVCGGTTLGQIKGYISTAKEIARSESNAKDV